MKQLILLLVIAAVVCIVSPPVRRIIFHGKVWRFLIVFIAVCGFVALMILGYFAWKYWWPLYMAKPTMQWQDETIHQDMNPVTPNTGKRSSQAEPIRFSWLSSAIFETAIAQQLPTQSDDYRVKPDVIDSGGKDFSKSSRYLLSDSLGESIVGHGESNDYKLDSGYRQPSAADFLSMNCSSLVDVGSVAGTGQQTGSGTCVVYTDAYSGYSLGWSVLTGSGGTNTGYLINQYNDTIAPFTPVVTDVPETWSVPAASSEWGGRVRSISSDAAAEWGTDTTSEKWLNVRTTNRAIASRTSATLQDGSTEILQFRAEVGASAFQPTGVYQTTVTLTVVGY